MTGRNDSNPLPGWQEINRQVRLAEQRGRGIALETDAEESSRTRWQSRIRRQARLLVQALVAAVSWLG